MSSDEDKATLLAPGLCEVESPDGTKRLSPCVPAESLGDVPEGTRIFIRDADGYYRPRRGPAKVSSQAYRSGWEGIFGAKNERGNA